MGEAYEALRQVAQLDRAELNDGVAYAATRQALQQCRAKVQTFLENPGLAGTAGAAAVKKLQDFDLKLQLRLAEIAQAEASFSTADLAFIEAKRQYSDLSPELVSPWEAAGVRALGAVLLIPVGMIGAEYYLNQLQGQRDAQRDAQAQRVLNTMNSELGRAQAQLPQVGSGIGTVPPPPPPPPVRLPTVTGGGGRRLPGGSFAPPNGSFTPPNEGSTPPPVSLTPTKPTPWRPPQTGPGSPGEPIGPGHQVPLPDLPDRSINPPWSDGPVGGYVPAPVLNADDPRWGANFRVAGFGDAAGGVGVAAGGLLGLGATALAARAAGSALSGGAALAFGSATGSGNVSGMAGVGGGAQVATGASAAGRVPGNGMLGGAAGGGTSGQDKKRRSGLVGYQVQRLDEDAPNTESLGVAGIAGSVAELAPVASDDGADRW